jgi:hypothetical protein
MLYSGEPPITIAAWQSLTPAKGLPCYDTVIYSRTTSCPEVSIIKESRHIASPYLSTPRLLVSIDALRNELENKNEAKEMNKYSVQTTFKKTI